MIVPMKRLAVFCVAGETEKALEALAQAGCVQLDARAVADASVTAAKEDRAQTELAIRLVQKAAKEHPASVTGDGLATVAEVLAADRELRKLAATRAEWARVEAAYAPFGDFDPALAALSVSKGLPVALVAGEKPEAPGAYVQQLGEKAWVVVGSYAGETMPLPPERLSAVRKRLADLDDAAARWAARLAATDAGRFSAKMPDLADTISFAEARTGWVNKGAVSLITGWTPESSIPNVRARATAYGWGIAFRDPEADETPPTLIRPLKLFRPVRALFEGLGIAPAYTESDVSVPFMCYFSLFFAMLVGDGGYGAIILAAVLWGWHTTKPKEKGTHRPALVRSWLTLGTVFSFATVVWGLLSNTWFGAGIPYCATLPTVEWLADPSYKNMMFLCFTIGASHLMLARVWSGLCALNDTVCLAQFGWAGIVFFMYWTVNAIVGIFPGAMPPALFWVFGVSLALVFLFTLKPSELKSRGIELGMLPLNVMSCLGDIISYVRLFAVGLASVKVAQNFNDMALANDWPLALKIPALIFILLIGHGLNFAMAGLSILVHAVRLNTLEFSNHKGITWAGYAFAPFKYHSRA